MFGKVFSPRVEAAAPRSMFAVRGQAPGSMNVVHGESRRNRRGPANPNYVSGKGHDGLGYVTLTSLEHGPDHGRREHQVVAEAMLGRPLESHEVVHHRNGDKTDNRPDNLQVVTRAEHPRLHLGKGRLIPCRSCGVERWHSPAAEARFGPKGYACRPCGGRWAP